MSSATAMGIVARSAVPSRIGPRFAKLVIEQRIRRVLWNRSSTTPRRSPLYETIARTRHSRRVAAAGAVVAFAVVAVASVAGDLAVPHAHRLPQSTARFEVPPRAAPPPPTTREEYERPTPDPAQVYPTMFRGGISMLDEPAPPIPWGREEKPDRPRILEAPSFTVGEGMQRAVILRIVRQNFGRFRVAYERGLKVNPALAGSVVVRFTIGRGGGVLMASDAGSTLPNQSVVGEIVRSFLLLAFPQPEKGPMVVTLPLDLNPHG